MLADWMPNRDFLVDWPGRRDKAFIPGLSRLKRDVWYAYINQSVLCSTIQQSVKYEDSQHFVSSNLWKVGRLLQFTKLQL